MKAVGENYTAHFDCTDEAQDGALPPSLLARIGGDLRNLYSGITESELPRSLLDLAEAIDARRPSDGTRA